MTHKKLSLIFGYIENDHSNSVQSHFSIRALPFAKIG